MAIKNDWLMDAYRRQVPVALAHTLNTLCKESVECNEDGGRYGGGAMDYQVWK